ncbi:MAG: restriction endonuclease subunit S [Bacteroidales bacterium]|nr:restriction endonuclease subunit S [Bacteroidales bacterium]
MERYNSYKDSGVKWLGEIPSHWDVIKSKYLWKESFSISENGNEELLSVSQYDGITPAKGDSRSESLKGYKIVSENDLVINIMLAWMGGLGVSKFDGIISPAYCVYKLTKDSNPKYLHYLYKTPLYLAEFARHSTGVIPSRWRMYTDDFGQVVSLLPPRKEQDAIVEYLDEKMAKIDAAIAQQQKMIDLLNERKQIIINRAVTKGLNPNAKMKDSGVEWIGEVPEGWEVRKTLFCLSMPITDGPHETPQLYEDGIPFVSAEAVSCGNGRIDFDHIRGYISKEFYDECCKKYTPRLHDIYMIKSGATTGKVALVDTNRIFTIWSPLAVFRCDENVMCHDYMFYMLQSDLYQLQVQLGWSYGTQQNIGMRTLEKLKVPVPPINEQIEIANYIIEKSKPIDDAISIANRQISLLQERKQIIINEVVTGKVKVV